MDFYHVYNRGVDKRDIFMDDYDRLRFLGNLVVFNNFENALNFGRFFTSSKDALRDNESNNKQDLVYIHFFCLMNNHYHLLISPKVENGIPLFMKKLNGGYSRYFNERHQRSGALFQGKYKSVLIDREPYFMYIPFYIHLNPLDLKMPQWRNKEITKIKEAKNFLDNYKWSSHLSYAGRSNFNIISYRNFFLDYFGSTPVYNKAFKEALENFEVDKFPHLTLE
jgi:putative transposase